MFVQIMERYMNLSITHLKSSGEGMGGPHLPHPTEINEQRNMIGRGTRLNRMMKGDGGKTERQEEPNSVEWRSKSDA